MVAVGEHVRDGSVVYRVVGVGEQVTLLRVTDSEGRRRATGEVVTVDDVDGYEPARDPDEGLRPVAWVRNLVSGMVWEVRALTGL